MTYFNSQFKILQFIIITALLFSVTGITGCMASEQRKTESPETADSLSVIPEYTPRLNRERPVVAVIGENSFTELTDYVVPYGILAEAKVADVFALSTREGPMKMFPALEIQAQNTIDDFDSEYPDGADYVVVPAVHDSDNPDLLDWVSEQAAKGATVIGVCDGVWVLAKSGLLKGRKAVSHWYSFKKLNKKYPETEWVENQRYLSDGNVITTTGVTASIPVSLALVEAIGGTERAADVAEAMGVKDWSAAHNSDLFKLGGGSILTAAKNKLFFWSHEDIGIPISEGVDEIGLALLADAYSRTYRSKAFSVAPSDEGITSSRGLTILPDKLEDRSTDIDRMVESFDVTPPAQVLDTTLQDIEHYYGSRTAGFVALQLEYPHQD